MTYEFIFRGKQPHKGALARTQGGILLVAVPRYTGANHLGATSVITIDQIAQQFSLGEILGTFGSHSVDSTLIIDPKVALRDGEKKHPALNPSDIEPFLELLLESYESKKIRYF